MRYINTAVVTIATSRCAAASARGHRHESYAEAGGRSIVHDVAVESLTAAGLGLDIGIVRLDRTSEDWLIAGTQLRDRVADTLVSVSADVEHIGSSSVLGLLAKPIVDLAVGLFADDDLPAVKNRLEAAGWIYRGDAGDDGGHVFVLEARLGHRVAHLHVVRQDDARWRNYLGFRDLLRSSSGARDRYEATKVWLAEKHPVDRRAYTDAKSTIVSWLLGSIA